MSSVSPSRRRVAVAGIRGVSRYDRVAGLLVSLVMLLGLSVGVLLFIWLAGRWADASGRAVPVVFNPGQGGDPESTDGGGLKLEAPTLEEIERETDLPLPGLKESLTQVDEIVRSHSVDLAQLDQTLLPPTAGGGAALGFGDSRAFGDGPGSGGVSRGERWEIGFTPGISLEEYRRQLDYFKIELAAVNSGGRVEYVATSPPRNRRSIIRAAVQRIGSTCPGGKVPHDATPIANCWKRPAFKPRANSLCNSSRPSWNPFWPIWKKSSPAEIR
ncbi:MAG: hypothetical protein QM775_27535 [Pirellulales bacterium]